MPISAEGRARISAASKARGNAHLRTPEVVAKQTAHSKGNLYSVKWGKARKVGDWEPEWHIKEIGRMIRAAREERDISLDELSAATGIGEATLLRIEHGKSRRARNLGATISSIVRIALALGVRPYELMP